MLQLDNRTPFHAAIVPMPDEDGVDAMYVCGKATFTLGPGPMRLAEQQRPIVRGDVHTGEPGRSSLREAGEHHLGKAGTDVVLVGHAHAPGGRAVPQLAVSIAVAERSKSIAVFGDRQWRGLDRVSSPAPFVTMPLCYERALGGSADHLDASAREIAAANPVGTGLDRRPGAQVANLEDPRAPIEGGGGRPRTVGLGPIAPGWDPRRRFAGTYDARWVRRRAPLLPEDFDRRFFNAAPAELGFDRFLQGGEPITAIGVSPHGPIELRVPTCELGIQACVRGSWRGASAVLETIALWPDDGVFTLTWRAKFPCDRRILEVERVDVSILRMTGVSA